MKTVQAIAIAAASLALATAPAFAGSATKGKSATVDLSGYNLKSEAGAKIALHEITRAARRVCDFYRPNTGTRAMRDAGECVKASIAETVQAMNSPMVTKVYKATQN